MASVVEFVQQILTITPYACQLGSGDRPPCPFTTQMLPILRVARQEHPYEGVFWAMISADGQGRTCEGSEVHFDAILYMEDPTRYDELTKREQSWLRIFEQAGMWRAEVIATGYTSEAPTAQELLKLLEADYAAGVDMGAEAQQKINYLKHVTIYMLENQK